MKSIIKYLCVAVLILLSTEFNLYSQTRAPYPYLNWEPDNSDNGSTSTPPSISCNLPATDNLKENILCNKVTEDGPYNMYVRDGANRTIYVTDRIQGVRYFTVTNFSYVPGTTPRTGTWDFISTEQPDIIAGKFTGYSDPNFPGICDNADADSCIIGNDAPVNSTNINESYDVDFRAIGEVRLINGFHVKRNAEFHAYIKPPYLDHEITSFPNHEDFSNYSGTDITEQRRSLRRYWTISGSSEAQPKFVPQSDPCPCSESAISFSSLGTSAKDIILSENFPRTVTGGDVHYGAEITSKDGIHTSNTPIGRYDALAKQSTRLGVQCAVWGYGTIGSGADEFDFSEIPTDGCRNGMWFKNYKWQQIDKGFHDFVSRGIGAYANVDDVGKTFHLYSLEIEKDEWRFLFDDCVVLRLPNFQKRFADIPNISKGYDFTKLISKYPIIWKLGVSIRSLKTYTENPLIGTNDFKIRYLRVFDR